MPDTRVSLEYQCPVCGASAVAGKHFCPTPGSAKTPVLKPKPPQKVAGVLRLAALVLATTLLWIWFGPRGLWGVGAIVLLWLLLEKRKGR